MNIKKNHINIGMPNENDQQPKDNEYFDNEYFEFLHDF